MTKAVFTTNDLGSAARGQSLPVVNNGPDFDAALRAHGLSSLTRAPARTLQVNVGKICNQACTHCHVEAGPKRTESMPRKVAERVVELLDQNPSIELIDITGGAPELNPNFRYLVAEARKRKRRVIDRCNLTVLFEPGMADLSTFLAAHQVEVVASMPCYSADNVERQRGGGVFDKSIRGLQELNALGYGKVGSALKLDLVYNPNGAFLPPAQAELEATYKAELSSLFGIEFHNLYTITNMAIKRFAHYLERTGKLESYEQLLAESFNASTVGELMCRTLLSVGWDGGLYDCDFNQMLEMDLGGRPRTVWDVASLADLTGSAIAVDRHCFGCTAGSGSSCSGALQG